MYTILVLPAFSKKIISVIIEYVITVLSDRGRGKLYLTGCGSGLGLTVVGEIIPDGLGLTVVGGIIPDGLGLTVAREIIPEGLWIRVGNDRIRSSRKTG